MIIGEAKAMRYLPSRRAYVQDKVRPGTGREGALGYERYAAGAWMHRSGQARPVALDTRLLSRTVMKEGTAHPQLCANAEVNGF